MSCSIYVSRSLYQFQVHGRAPPRTRVYDQMEQLFTNRKFHFSYHRNFRVFFLMESALCVLICCFSLSHFILHSIGMLPFSLHPSPLSATFDHFSRDTSRVSVRPIKTFLHRKPKRKFFPWTRLWEGICPIFWRICKLLAVFISLAIMGWLNLLTKCLIM